MATRARQSSVAATAGTRAFRGHASPFLADIGAVLYAVCASLGAGGEAALLYDLRRAMPRSTRKTAPTTIAADAITFRERCSLASHQPSRTATIGFT